MSLETIADLTGVVVLTTCALIYFGIVLYITAMVNDMKMRMELIDWDSKSDSSRPSDQIDIWPIYVHEIEFHIDLIG